MWHNTSSKLFANFFMHLLILLVGTTGAFAQTCDESVQKNFKIYYPINKIHVDPNYMDNANCIGTIRRHFFKSPRIDSIVIYSYASPEGPLSFNRYLSVERGKDAKRFIQSLIPGNRQLPDSIIRLRPVAENWAGLRQEVENAYQLADRQEVLSILNSTMTDEEKKLKLQHLDGGQSWQYILRNIMPKLRYATWVSVWIPILPEILPPTLEEVEHPAIEEVLPPVEIEPKALQQVLQPMKERKTIFALKTNMLYDVAMLLNASLEVPVYKNRVSLLYQHHFPWFNWGEGNNKYCIRFLSFGGEARWWFLPNSKKRDRLNGHFIGLYGMGGKYDFNWKRNICYQGEFWSTGLSYGYSMPIGKRLNLEFTASAGYASIPYRHYIPTDNYEILVRDPDKQGRLNYFGITKAEVSLVVPIVLSKTKKGGNR
jgi:hypothetical protein